MIQLKTIVLKNVTDTKERNYKVKQNTTKLCKPLKPLIEHNIKKKVKTRSITKCKKHIFISLI